MDAYLALTSPESSEWTPQARDYAGLLRMFSVRQPFPLLLAARRRFQSADFEAILRAIVVISFRYNVIGNLATGEQERIYHAVASRIATGDYQTSQQVMEGIRHVYPRDDFFRASFAEKTIGTTQSRNRKIVRYILCELEKQSSGQQLDFQSDAISIEHICPENPEENWQNFSDEELEAFSSRLGNFALLSHGANNALGNAGYAAKRAAYLESAYQTTRDIAEKYHDWTPEKITSRQKAMATIATSIWRISQLS